MGIGPIKAAVLVTLFGLFGMCSALFQHGCSSFDLTR